ncbi:MAG: nucleotide-binding protein [Planctomycetaceae bacterium]|nr:nucleotide-binding protein [Planctomycetaceae bacterium]
MYHRISDLLEEKLEELLPLTATRAEWPKIDAWCTGVRPIIQDRRPSSMGDFSRAASPTWQHLAVTLGPSYDRQTEIEECRRVNDARAEKSKLKLVALLRTVIQLMRHEEGAGPQPSTADQSPKPLNERVFIVHAHDGDMKNEVARVIRCLGLTEVILEEQPNSGRTILQKFKDHSDVGFAVVLLSGDDKGYPIKHNKRRPRPRLRARQNVIFELGYFIGRLQPSCVFALKESAVIEIPSDLLAFGYSTYEPRGTWRNQLVSELRAAGYSVSSDDLP